MDAKSKFPYTNIRHVIVEPELQCYATSATIGDKNDLPKVAQFAESLFGESFEQGDSTPSVITGVQDPVTDELHTPCWGSLPLELWFQIREVLKESNEALASMLDDLLKPVVPQAEYERYSSENDCLLGLGKVLLGEETTFLVVNRLSRDLLDLTNLDNIGELGVMGLEPNEAGIELLTAIIEVLAVACRSEDVPVLTSRYHSFMRAPEGLYLNLRDGQLLENKTTELPYMNGGQTPVYEVSVCRHCGQAYLLGSIAVEGKVQWLNPAHSGSNVADDYLPREYFRIAKADDDVEDESIAWLCPVCGSIHGSESNGCHRFKHEDVNRIPLERGEAIEDEARCGHCGYQNRYAIQPMRVSPEAAGSVVCSELARRIPPFEEEVVISSDNLFSGLSSNCETEKPGSIVCFSDRRQDAAFFAPAMDRTYSRITYRQMFVEAVSAQCKDGDTCSPNDVVRWLATEGLKRHKVNRPDLDSSNAKRQFAMAVVLDELMAEDIRQSTEGLGVVRCEPTLILKYLDMPTVAMTVTKTVERIKADGIEWIDDARFKTLILYLLENLRQSNTVEVPEGVSPFRLNKKKKLTLFFKGVEESGESGKSIAFVGSAKGSENGRSRFLRKYAEATCGQRVSREDVQLILGKMFDYLQQLLDFIGKEEDLELLKRDAKGMYYLSSSIWTLRPHRANDISYRCDICGIESQLDTDRVCRTQNCAGHMIPITFVQGEGKDAYYKSLYQEDALPLRIEEHTAQLSTERAREIQKEFIAGKVHILSCTTTFELGVDVGDLRAVFMRNVPPSAANYTQRAGRTGRRAGMPGYAITFARLRPHDISFFRRPQDIIHGKMSPPHCYMDNDAVAIRHVFAVALSQYFRDTFEEGTCDYARIYNDFASLDDAMPQGLEKFRAYLEERKPSIESQFDLIFKGNESLKNAVGIKSWSWIEELVGPTKGRLSKAHELKHSDYMRLKLGAEENRESRLGFAHALERSMKSLKGELTINVLAANGIIPKYGFPTDLVGLNLIEQSSSTQTDSLRLQRGLRQAIAEYAPGAEVVASKKLWKSVGIHKLKGREWEIRNYESCPNCKNFIWAIENGERDVECPCCHNVVQLNRRMLVPSFGFDGEESKDKSVGQKRPRSTGFSKVCFSQRWPDETRVTEVSMPGGTLSLRYASNAQLCVRNEGGYGAGYCVCSYCGAAAPIGGNERVPHRPFCKEKYVERFSSIGTSFTSDVLDLSFSLSSFEADESDWESVMWALITASNELLEMPESELGGTIFSTSGTMSLMLYDDVPGGAGHVLRISQQLESLLNKAFEIVDTCTCNEDTCCYGCLCNYRNQPRQQIITRGGALRILKELLQGDSGKAGEERCAARPKVAKQ